MNNEAIKKIAKKRFCEVKVNSEESYLGKDIREWCMNNTEDSNATEIREKYFSDEVDFKPGDKVYYFVDYISAGQSYKECGSLNMCGCRLIRDTERSPRPTSTRLSTRS